ncbi:hypothetical protein [Calothrix sp. CCY 0018]|uniref:hypothetical protein n=1 Tax=Calothrix sp. CCY 0018 TaxID=3103864 RepID=UPI0039C66333
MSENPLYYSGLQTSKTSNLKPAISAALASLEVQLDQELSRYRRTRIAHRTPIQKSLGSLIAAKSPSSNVIAAASSQSQQNLTGKEAAAYIRQQQASISANEIKTTPPPPPPALETFPEVTSNKELNTEIASSQGQVPFPSATTNTQNQTESTPNQSSIVKADTNRNTPPENISPPKDDTKSQPDDYLESSEALLRSLQEEQQPQTKKPKNNNDSLLSPLSIGSMLLLLVSSITFGYIIFNLDDLASFSLGGLFKRNEQITSSENTETVSDVNADDKKLAPPVSRNPNLANDALPNINSIDDVAGATPKGEPTQAAKPSNPVTTTAPVEQMSPPVANTPAPESPVSETEAVTTPQNLDEIEPSNGGFYNVIVDNTGNTLAEVKKVIPDAYLSPEGKYVYLGAFKSKTRLKNHLELLKENGITARVEEPDS